MFISSIRTYPIVPDTAWLVQRELESRRIRVWLKSGEMVRALLPIYLGIF
jgi:hypothetical protein